MTPHLRLVVLGASCLVATGAGFRAGKQPARGLAMQVALVLCAVVVAFSVQSDWVPALAIATLPCGIYLTFKAWSRAGTRQNAPFEFAFVGAAWLLAIATRNFIIIAAAGLLGIYGPTLALWLQARTSLTVGRLLIVAAVAFQMLRVVHLLDAF